MTRFARAKGSKASNERVPEAATPWSEMKKQLLEKNQQGEEVRKRKVADKRREENYKAFLQQADEEKAKNVKWAEFPAKKGAKKVETNNNDGEVDNKKKGAKRKIKADENALSKKRRKSEEVQVPEGAKVEKKKLKKGKKGKLNDCESETKEDLEPKLLKKRKLKQGDGNTEGSESMKSDMKKKQKTEKTVTENCKEGDSKFEKKKPKTPKITARKKGIKKVNQPLTETDLKKIDKKKQKKIRQVEKKKQFQPTPNSNPQLPKKYKDKQKNRRKQPQDSMIINGKEVAIAYVDGFPIKKEDAERIHQLRKQMISKGLPRSEIKISLKLERRKAEKAFAREKKKVCFNCRKSGHNLSDCPDLGTQLAESAGTGICFKCGSTEHTHFECKVVKGQEFRFAQCFICHEQGHIARQCPDNARGLYPKGGACKVCGDVTHLKKDCPKFQAQQKQLEQSVQIETMDGGDNPDVLEKGENNVILENKRVNKVIKFLEFYFFKEKSGKFDSRLKL